jgi:DNA mismatch repair protein MutH
VELKTIPIDRYGNVLETTYVCYAHTHIPLGTTWHNCAVRNKLQQVLFVPVLGEREIPPPQRIVGMPTLWTPSSEQDALLQQDWEELTELISMGNINQINASLGEALHIRPKAANGQALTDAVGENGEKIHTRPRGFYLRKDFTQQIIN